MLKPIMNALMHCTQSMRAAYAESLLKLVSIEQNAAAVLTLPHWQELFVNNLISSACVGDVGVVNYQKNVESSGKMT